MFFFKKADALNFGFHYWKLKFLCVLEIGYRGKLSEKLILTANRQANPDKHKVIEKLQLPLGR